MEAYKKIAKILRSDQDNIFLIEKKMGALTGRNNIMTKLIEENESVIRERLDILGLGRNIGAKEVYDALISKIEADNDKLFKKLDMPSALVSADWQRVLDVVKKVSDNPKGLFLKKEKAIELLKSQPPMEILRVLNYNSIEDLLAKEDVFEIFSALRFVEGNKWLNEVFFKQYESLKPEDFEEREITVLALPERWAKIAESFIKHKYHNISHLKELGVIFVIPLSLEVSGEILRNFGLLLHYFNEIKFYSDLFKKIVKNNDKFANDIISLLRGDIINSPLTSFSPDKTQWLVIQQYLAKDDENDWRLFQPHINPEALHWEKAERMLVKTGEILDGFSADLAFWEDLNWVGDYFMTESGINVLVSFNLIDTAMSLVKEKELIKYLYHHQEALWNKIFMEYFSEGEMEEFMKQNILKGWFEI
ncbi:hypothetical protein JW698_02010 [Candidatus Wolfebacteria bacterium]|nr:hypothetical protein [Candidatus Wolfebacteria bacterium]